MASSAPFGLEICARISSKLSTQRGRRQPAALPEVEEVGYEKTFPTPFRRMHKRLSEILPGHPVRPGSFPVKRDAIPQKTRLLFSRIVGSF